MFRTIISLFLLATLNPMAVSQTAPISKTAEFNESSLLDVQPIPIKNNDAIEPVIDAKAALLMDYDTSTVMYSKNEYQPLPMASLTKIMTASIILDSHKLDEVVTIDENYAAMSDDVLGVRMWLVKGEKITVGNLLMGLLIPSAGDAAMALAKYHSGSVGAFVKEMNKKAEILNLKNTHFVNPIGMDAAGHYASAYDLAILTKYALRNKDFRRIVRTTSASVTSVDGKTVHQLNGTNFLLNSYLDIEGVKTGTTDGAGECLINLAKNENGREIIVVLLNSPDRFQENKSIIDWAFRNFSW